MNFLKVELACSPYGNSASSYGFRSAESASAAPRRTANDHFFWTLVLCALLLAQTLGLVHSLAHSPAAVSGPATELHHHHEADEHDHHGLSWLDKLFSGHEEEGGNCRLFDHQGHSAFMPSVATLALPSVLHAWVAAEWAGCHLAASAASFDARAPPFLH